MSAIPITIVGIETRDDGTSGQVTIVGMANITGLTVGGGPILPTPPPGHPAHPIYIPGEPTHPIVIPPPPIDPPDESDTLPVSVVVKEPPPAGGWGWLAPYGWGYFPQGSGAGPKR
jgi:hypothetical protein